MMGKLALDAVLITNSWVLHFIECCQDKLKVMCLGTGLAPGHH